VPEGAGTMSDGLMICEECQCVTSCLAHVWMEKAGQRERLLVCMACRRLFQPDGSMKEPE